MSQLFNLYPGLTPTPTGEAALSNWLDEDHDPGDNFLGGQYDLGATLDFDEMREIAEAVDFERSLFSDLGDFDTEEDIAAGYGMAEVNFGRALMLMGGLRYENTRTFFRAFNGVVGDERNTEGSVFDTTSTQRYDHWFPMVHLRYRPVPWFDVRLAYTHTLSRPDFRYISPRSRIRDTSRRIDRGTPGLRPAEATNYDLFLSFNGNKLGLFTVGGFIKEIDGIIYTRTITVLDPEALMLPRRTQGYRLTDPINHPETTLVRGFEVEWQANFLYLPRPFDGIVFNANYARIYSDTGFLQVNVVRLTEPPFGFINEEVIRDSRMPDQSNDIANVSLGYERGGFSGRVSMLYQGNTLSRIGGRAETDGLTEALLRWDAQAQQRIFGNLNVFLQLNNITNRRDASRQATFGFPTDQEYYGFTAALGVRYRTR